MQIKTLRLQRFCDLPKVIMQIKPKSLDLFQGLAVSEAFISFTVLDA